MNSFIWRSLNCVIDGNEIRVQNTKKEAGAIYQFPSPVRHAHAMDQNTILVLLEDNTLWQCGSVPQGPLILAAAATKIVFGWVLSTIERLGPETYAALAADLRREFNNTFKREDET